MTKARLPTAPTACCLDNSSKAVSNLLGSPWKANNIASDIEACSGDKVVTTSDKPPATKAPVIAVPAVPPPIAAPNVTPVPVTAPAATTPPATTAPKPRLIPEITPATAVKVAIFAFNSDSLATPPQISPNKALKEASNL